MFTGGYNLCISDQCHVRVFRTPKRAWIDCKKKTMSVSVPHRSAAGWPKSSYSNKYTPTGSLTVEKTIKLWVCSICCMWLKLYGSWTPTLPQRVVVVAAIIHSNRGGPFVVQFSHEVKKLIAITFTAVKEKSTFWIKQVKELWGRSTKELAA